MRGDMFVPKQLYAVFFLSKRLNVEAIRGCGDQQLFFPFCSTTGLASNPFFLPWDLVQNDCDLVWVSGPGLLN